MPKNVGTCNNLRISCCRNKINAITASHFNEPCASLKAATRLCPRRACKRVQPRNLHSLFTVGSFDTYIFLISFNRLKIYVLMFILFIYIYITLFLKSLFTCKLGVITKLGITLLFWQYLCYEQSSYVVICLDL
jgi:hypothetical protein